jgi:hypothetical protein
VHDARLEDCLGEGGLDGIGQPRQAIGAQDQDVLHPSLAELGEDDLVLGKSRRERVFDLRRDLADEDLVELERWVMTRRALAEG